MTGEFQVGDWVAAPGSKTEGVQQVEVAGHAVDIPVFVIHGARPGPTLAVTAGIHGAEYASIAAALEVGQALDPADLAGRVVVAPVANMPAFRARSIYVCPLDGINLNRVFPGKADGSASEQLADWLFRHVIQPADYYVDMHGGDLIEALVPFTIFGHTGNEELDTRSLELARAYGIPYLVRSDTQGGTYGSAARAGIPAILAEAGGQGIWLREHVQAHVDGLMRVMRHLGMLEGPAPEPVKSQVLDRFIWLRSEHTGYFYPKVGVGQTVQKGQDLGAVTDFRGQVLQPIVASDDGDVLFLVTSLAINESDPLLAIGA